VLEHKLLSLEGELGIFLELPCIKTESLESDGVGETTVPIFFELAESDVVVGSLGARDTGLNCG